MVRKYTKIVSVVLFTVASYFALPLSITAQTAGKRVRIEAGLIEGTVSGDVISFKGIPYAAPPVGNLRWRAPQPVSKWKGVRKATEFGNDCVQKSVSSDVAPTGSVRGEDCLVANVWHPAAVRSGEKLPVLVWIHGGGFLNGSASDPLADGSAFARQGIVFFSFNYRLGRMGFFAHPALSAANEGALGNYGLMDQLAALKWVRDNISAFGGDLNRVTVVGESAGGISIVHLLAWTQAKGLFQQAMILSGGGRDYLIKIRKLSEASGSLPSAEQSGIEFAKSAGITETGPKALAALRALPAEKVNGDLSMLALLMKPPTYAGGPIFDGKIITRLPEEAFERGEGAKVPLIIGTTSQDLPVSFPPSREDPLSFFGADKDKAAVLYNRLDPRYILVMTPGGDKGNPTGKLSTAQIFSAIAVDLTMHEQARFLAQQMTGGGMPVWFYRFGYVAESLRPGKMGAEHASELPFMFNTLDTRYPNTVTENDRATARAFHNYVSISSKPEIRTATLCRTGQNSTRKART